MQEFIGDLTVEQFARLIGLVLGVSLSLIGLGSFVIAFINSFFDGWSFRKGSLYYGSLRYLNQCFKKLKNCGTAESLDNSYNELVTAISLLRYQRTIPKFLYERLCEKLDFIYRKRKIEICDYWSG